MFREKKSKAKKQKQEKTMILPVGVISSKAGTRMKVKWQNAKGKGSM